MKEVGANGKKRGVCLPEVNTADEMRWTFMRRVHQDCNARTRMPAADALPETLS